MHPIAFWPTKTQHLPPLWQCQHTLWGRMSFFIWACPLIPLQSHPKRGNAWSLPIQFPCFTQDFTALGDILFGYFVPRRRLRALFWVCWALLESEQGPNPAHLSCSRCPTHSNSGRTRLDMPEPKMNQTAGVRNTTLQAKKLLKCSPRSDSLQDPTPGQRAWQLQQRKSILNVFFYLKVFSVLGVFYIATVHTEFCNTKTRVNLLLF